MAKTLKTGDVKRYPRDDIFPGYNWVSISGRESVWLTAARTRQLIRKFRGPYERIAKVIKRTPKYVFVEVSK